MTDAAASPASATEALAMLESAMAFLAAADAVQMGAEAQAQALMALERLDAVQTAARTSILGAFGAGRGYSADAEYSARAWLIHKTKVTKGAAVGHTAWVRRATRHPEVMKVLAAGEISESFARTICTWTDKLPSNCRDAADVILVGGAVGGLGLADVAALAREMLDRYQSADPDPDQPDEAFEDRSVRLDTTLDGAAVLTGDLTPECSAALTAVLNTPSAPRGAEDIRSHAQRYHDGLQEAMQRLLAAGLLPERAGRPVKAWVHVSLADLMLLEGSSALLAQWSARVRAAWAAHRAAASVTGSDGGAWLDGDAARAAACDATTAPVVMGEVNYEALDGLIRLCVELARLEDTESAWPVPSPDESGAAGNPSAGVADLDIDVPASGSAAHGDAATAAGSDVLAQAIIGKAIDLLSGPGGLASFLRRRQLGTRLGGPSVPLDVGVSRDIPAAIRAAIILRDQHCRFPGGYFL